MRDPILQAIANHKAAFAEHASALGHREALEREIPAGKRRSTIDLLGEDIVETDDPRWIEAERQVHLCFEAEDAAAWALLKVPPTTRDGVLELIAHAMCHGTSELAWPDGWRAGLTPVLAEALPRLWRAA
ncbi:hypothetical protein AAFX91_39215 [Bradyrhizobium sp. 31Argb]|uniref:hypothetical protein n=1 Tax=Bradyrhizobium sp. 31Argb TaxID=3141247 RepID=UPI003749DD40